MTPHRHRWLLRGLVLVSGKDEVVVRYRCLCGRRHSARTASRAVVEVARFRAK